MRKSYVQDPKTGQLVPKEEFYAQQYDAPFIMGDLPDYESPIDGRVISGRAARREDLRRSGCREWEGMEQEKKEAHRWKVENERKLDQKLEQNLWRAWYSMSPDKRKKMMY